MKQIIQDLKKGNTILEEVPVPNLKYGNILIRTTKSLVSLGTEKMLIDFGKANLIEKAKQQPDKVKMVIDKIKTVKTIMLRGELGSGKTTLVKSVLKRMGVNDSVTSPTFSIINEYDFAGNIIYHFDLYRIENIEELNVIGFEDYIYSQNN